MKLCKDCRHAVKSEYRGEYLCSKSEPLLLSPELPVDPVWGEVPYQPAILMRYDKDKCGVDAKWFEAWPVWVWPIPA